MWNFVCLPEAVRRLVTILLFAAVLLPSGLFERAGFHAALHAQSGTIVLWTSRLAPGDMHGDWALVSDSTAAGGARVRNPNRNRKRLTPAQVAPADYFEIAFNASAGVPYYLWLRMKVDGNSTSNDSVHVQFDRAVNASGQPIVRIGSTSSFEPVLQDGSGAPAPYNWGWTSNGWNAAPTPVYFAQSGQQIIRVQMREDGPSIDQIVLSPGTYTTNAPGPRRNDTRILARTDGVSPPAPSAADTHVIWTASIPSDQRFGNWTRVSDSTAAGGAALRNPNQGAAKISPARATPTSYFEATFEADAGRNYHVWIRGRADSNHHANDSVHLQFSDSLNTSGQAFARIGTTSSAEFVLQAGPSAASPYGWNWTDNGWGSLGSHIRFATSGTHTVRVQQREDGVTIDQIVISPDAYLTTPPGARRNDSRILPESELADPAENQLPSVTLTAPANGASYAAPASISLAATASDPEGRLARVEFYNGSARLGTDTTSPFTFSWTNVAAGSYSLRAIAYDAEGNQRASNIAAVTVSSAPPTTRTYTVVFGASSNHATAVSSYLLEVFASGANPSTATPLTTSNLGKPTPNSSNEISVDRSSFFNGLAAGTYVVTVKAIGAGGEARSNPFTLTR